MCIAYNQHEMEQTPLTDFKVRRLLAVGDAECGKKNLLNSAAYPGFTGKPCSFIEINQTQVILYLMSISGMETDNKQRAQCYDDIDVVLLCFSIDNPDSLSKTESKWMPEVFQFCPEAPVMLIGLKKDLRTDQATNIHLAERDQEPVGTDDAIAVANKIGASLYVECSAIKDEGVLETFLIAGCASARMNFQNIARFRVDTPAGLSLTYNENKNLVVDSQISDPESKPPLPLNENNHERNSSNGNVAIGNLQNVYWVENSPNGNLKYVDLENDFWINNEPNESSEEEDVQNRCWDENFSNGTSEEENFQSGYWIGFPINLEAENFPDESLELNLPPRKLEQIDSSDSM